MKRDIFDQYLDKVSALFSIDKSEIFKKNKKREFVDARYLLYYLCFNRPMQISYIQKYMSENGYDIKHTSIIHGVGIVTDKVNNDRDYMTIVREIARTVSV